MKLLATEIKKENEILRRTSEDVSLEEIKSPKIQKIIKEMLDFIREQPDGAALAAPQIGVLKKIFIINPIVLKNENGKLPSDDECVFINPKIIKKSKQKVESEEGCFSVRWYYGEVDRYKNVTIEYQNSKGEKKVRGAGGFLAIVFQHEIDHLYGTVFIDKARDLRKMTEEEIQDIKNQQKELLKRKGK